MIQTLALLIDAYRDLNARKLFWITMILSALVMTAFAFFAPSGTDLVFAKWHISVTPLPALLIYKMIFSFVVIGIWLTWAAVGLALVSTAGLFPDLISGGTIDLYLSKPIGRLRLFLTKYFTGLLFVTLQVAVFTLGTFLVFGWRGKEWRWSLFLAIPIVVCVFSYLFAFCVLFGVWTRSTIAALLITVLLWFVFWGAQKSDSFFLYKDAEAHARLYHAQRTIDAADHRLSTIKPGGPVDPEVANLKDERQRASADLPDLQSSFQTYHTIHNITKGVCAVIPKTSQTDDLLDRWLFKDEEAIGEEQRREQGREKHGSGYGQSSGNPFAQDDEVAQDSASEIATTIRARSIPYVIGTSLLCEIVVVGFAAWIFCRRDY